MRVQNNALNIGLKRKERFPIIDALPFTLALWVTMGYLGVFPLFAGVNTDSKLGHFLVHAWSSTVWGVPAVIGFFVISGFLYPSSLSACEMLRLCPYYVRRYVRILIPVCVFVHLSAFGGFSAHLRQRVDTMAERPLESGV